jgi:hypothetical protein
MGLIAWPLFTLLQRAQLFQHSHPLGFYTVKPRFVLRASLSSTLLVAWECIFESKQHCHRYRQVIDVFPKLCAWRLGFLISYPPLKHINMLADVEEEFFRLAVQWRSVVDI